MNNGMTDPLEPKTFPYLTTEKLRCLRLFPLKLILVYKITYQHII